MRAPKPSCVPFMNVITENCRIHTAQTLRRALGAMGYPLTNRTTDLLKPYKYLRERGWVTRHTGTFAILHCAPDVTEEEAVNYCKSHGISISNLTGTLCTRAKRAERPDYLAAASKCDVLTAYVRAISGTYARARFSEAWRTT